MTKNVLVGVSGKARKAKKIYVGVGDKARKVKAMYVGVNGIARKCWPNSRIPDPGYVELDYVGVGEKNTLIQASYNKRIVLECEFPDVDPGWNYGGLKRQIIRCTYLTSREPEEEGGTSYGYIVGTDHYLSNDWFVFTDRHTWNETDTTNSGEGVLKSNRYRFDFNNNKKFYIYSDVGYYSVSSHNLVATINVGSTNPVQVDYIYVGSNYGDGMYVYSLKIYSGSTLVGDFVPAEKVSTGATGLYDLVNRRFV